jgi:hypothetical protein
MMTTTTGANVKKLILVMVAIVGLAALPTVAQAVPISGDLNLGGRVTVDAVKIDWLELGGIGGTHEFIVLDGTNYFNFLDLTFGDAIDLINGVHPVGVTFSLPNFLTFDADSGLSFELTYIAPCAGTDCLFPGTPFNAYEKTGPTRTTVEMGMIGKVHDTTGPNGPGDAFWVGTWSADFANTTIAQLRAAFAPGGPGFITAPYSADLKITAVPEPMTLLTFGTGTALMAAYRRRRTKKNLA